MDIKQRLAQAVHAQWSIWQEYQNKQRIDSIGDGETPTFSGEQWLEWHRKANTRYQDLTPEEQKSDLEIAEKIYIPLLIEYITENRQHFIARHRYCDDVKQCMDHLLKELQAAINDNNKTELEK